MLKKDKEEVKFSRRLNAEIKKYKLSANEKAFADLILSGWHDFDAFLISNLYNPVYNKEANMREMNRLLTEDKAFTDYIKMIEKKKSKTWDIGVKEETEIDMSAELSKEAQLRELLIAKKKHDVGSKEWLDVVKMIADITQAKKDEIKEEDNTVHFYLPLSCRSCSLYIAHLKKQRSGV